MKGVDSASQVKPGTPIRMCIGCRVKARKTDLLRVVGQGSRVVPDPTAVHPGRGAYLHPDVGCYELATRRRAFARALRITGEIDTTSLRAALSPDQSDQPQVSREHRMSTP